jgi:hypothetical protein
MENKASILRLGCNRKSNFNVKQALDETKNEASILSLSDARQHRS